MSPYDSISPATPLAQSLDPQVGQLPASAASGMNDEDFSKQWVQLTATVDALRSLLEDSYVDWTKDLYGRVQSALTRATDDPLALVAVAREVALLRPLIPIFDRREIDFGLTKLTYLIRRAPLKKPSFLISTGTVRKLPILDDSLTNPAYCKSTIDAFVALIQRTQEVHGVNFVAFIDKNFGPIGALGMISSIVQATGLHATIYRERKWSKNADFSGYLPKSGDKGVIVYDLFNTGAGIKNAAHRICERFPVAVPAAVLLYTFDKEIQEVTIESGAPLAIYALDSAQDSQAPIVPNPTSILTRKERKDVLAGEAGTQLRSSLKGKEMPSSPNIPIWRAHLDSYRAQELIALAFPSQKMMDKATDAIWNDAEFVGMPCELARSDVIFVPREAAPILRAKQIKFEEQLIAS